MQPERWQQIDQLFHLALEREPNERALFLAQRCSGDESLRSELEALISSHELAESFIETPASDLAAELLAKGHAGIGVGQSIGPYKILSVLGMGGMGEVYLAQDTRLGRQVALKLLPAQFTINAERVRRFEQEARTASALNHPNIVTIHEIGRMNGTQFIVTEFVDGPTLRQHMADPLNLNEVLDVATQVSSALAAAHEAGIVHRDIKPENIMLRRDRIVKVLDFGLAKLAPQQVAAVDADAPTKSMVKTNPGVVMGTVNYMSPEQSRGLEVDTRTDIWSLGVVLYEMVTGRAPFAGETASDVIAAILKTEPAPLVRDAPEAPDELQRITRKCLEKNREERYQTAEDMLVDLKGLRRELEIEAEVERSKQAITNSEPAATTSRDQVITSRLFPPGLTRSRTLILTALMGMLIIAGLGSALFFRQSSTPALQSEIKSLAVLPLKSLNREAGDDYLGLGIADTIITKVSQVGGLTVRPTSAVRRYLKEETDALAAARQLEVDAVLDGTVQRADDRLRVSVNLLRTSDGASLWADSFDTRASDIFTIQDTMARQVASHLQLRLDPAQQARLAKRYTPNAIAYEYYLKGVYRFDERGLGGIEDKPQMEATIDFFRKAVEADPNYALAHAQLAYAYAWMAVYIEPMEPVWAERAKEEINRAQALDPQLAETHVVRHHILLSAHGGWQLEAAIRELLLAQQLNPNVGHNDLAADYLHLGLEDLFERQAQRALDIDPTSEIIKKEIASHYWAVKRYDEWLAIEQKYFNGKPNVWYLLGKGRWDEAQTQIERTLAKEPDDLLARRYKAILLALKGDYRAAEAEIPFLLSKFPVKIRFYHHITYDIACIYALAGKRAEAVKWLRETAATGFPCYPLFERDPYLNRIRQAPEFVQFMAEMKAQFEKYKREFAQ